MQTTKLERAKQFLPFDALTGFREAILKKEQEFQNVKRIELCDESYEILEKEFDKLEIGSIVNITYYINKGYHNEKGKVTKIDTNKRKIYINENGINVDDILKIEI